MKEHIAATIGPMPVADVAAADIVAVLDRVWDRPELARRTAQRISTTMTWAMGRGLRETDPTAAAVVRCPSTATGPHIIVRCTTAKSRGHDPRLSGEPDMQAGPRTGGTDRDPARRGAIRRLVRVRPRRRAVDDPGRENQDRRRSADSAAAPSGVSGAMAGTFTRLRTGLVFPSPATGAALSNNTWGKLLGPRHQLHQPRLSEQLQVVVLRHRRAPRPRRDGAGARREGPHRGRLCPLGHAGAAPPADAPGPTTSGGTRPSAQSAHTLTRSPLWSTTRSVLGPHASHPLPVPRVAGTAGGT